MDHYSPLPEVNFDLLEEAVSWAYWSSGADLKDEAKLGYFWRQTAWAGDKEFNNAVEYSSKYNECSSSFCISGYAAMVSGFTAKKLAPNCGRYECNDSECEHTEVLQTTLVNADKWIEDDPEIDSMWHRVGRDLLGLTEDEAVRLFDGDNMIEDVVDIAQGIVASRGLPELNVERWELKIENEKIIDGEMVFETSVVRRAA